MNPIGSGDKAPASEVIHELYRIIPWINASDDCGQRELAKKLLTKAKGLIMELKLRKEVDPSAYVIAEGYVAFLEANLRAPHVSLEESRLNYGRAFDLHSRQETEADQRSAQARILASLGEVLRHHGELEEAASKLEDASRLLDGHNPHMQALIAYRKGKLYLDQHDWAGAVAVLSNAESMMDGRRGHRHGNLCVAIRIALVTAYRLNGQRDAAQQLVTHINPIVQQLKKIEAAKSPIVIERGPVSKKRRPTTTEKEVVFQPCFPTQLEERALAVVKWNRRLPFFGQLPKQPLEL